MFSITLKKTSEQSDENLKDKTSHAASIENLKNMKRLTD